MTRTSIHSMGSVNGKIEKNKQQSTKLKVDSINDSSKHGYYYRQNQKKKKQYLQKENYEKPPKLFFLDTNVFIHDPECLFVFGNNNIILCQTCLDELDGLKNSDGIKGYSARECFRKLGKIFGNEKIGSDCIRKIGDNLGYICIVNDNFDLCERLKWNKEIKDHIIISTVFSMQELNPDKEVIFVTRDNCAKLKAISIGIKTEDYENDRTNTFEIFGDILEPSKKPQKNIKSVLYQSMPNNNKINNFGFSKISSTEREVFVNPQHMFGISARNIEQACIINALLDDNIKVVAISGPAGTGKTMLSIMAGIFQTLDWNSLIPDEKGEEYKEYKRYDKIIFTRAIIPIGDDIGFLPGDKGEKFGPWMKLVSSNVEFLSKVIKENILEQGLMKDKTMKTIDKYLFSSIELEPITYMRGINIFNSFVVIDESQNITPNIMKTIITRIGEGSKVVVLFDPEQIDNRYLDEFSNGAVYLVDKYIETEEYFCYIKAKESIRSLVAKRAAELL